jgi:cell volume regulation protein A
VTARGSRLEAERRLRAVSRGGRLATWRGEFGEPSETD